MDPLQQAPAAKRITGRLTVAGLQFEVIDFPPDLFPQGAILLSQHPLKFELIDRLVLTQGSMIAILNPVQAERLRAEVLRAAATAKRPDERPL